MNYTNFQYFLGDAEPCDNQRDLEKKIDVESTSEYEEFEQPDLFGENNMEEQSHSFVVFPFIEKEDSLLKELENIHSFPHKAQTPELPTQNPPPYISTEKNSINSHKKNSNSIKKIGRIILDNLEEYIRNDELNQGVQSMLKLLAKRSSNSSVKDERDGFNTSHLKALFHECPEETSVSNLSTTQKLFNKNLRKQVLKSCQIKDNKNIYLNSLKVSALRCCNKFLAVRLQLSESS